MDNQGRDVIHPTPEEWESRKLALGFGEIKDLPATWARAVNSLIQELRGVQEQLTSYQSLKNDEAGLERMRHGLFEAHHADSAKAAMDSGGKLIAEDKHQLSLR